MIFLLRKIYEKIKNWLSLGKPENTKYQELHQSGKSPLETEVDIKEQEKQIKWIKDNVKFYPMSRTTVYHERSAYDILMACHQHNLNYQEAPRLFKTAVRWNISYLDMAEMMSNVDRAQTSP